MDIQIVQGNTVISELPAKGPIMLEPKPFALKIKGSVDEFSILPLADPKLFASVRFGNRPLCAMEGTGGAYTPGDMFLHSKELELFEGDAKGIAALCGDKDESKADPKMLEIISNQFKVTPLILTSGRMYIMKEDGRGGKEGNLTVKTIEDKTPAKGQKIWLILMLENPLGEGLKEIEWIEVPLEFVAEKP